jgi:hypothetical protein
MTSTAAKSGLAVAALLALLGAALAAELRIEPIRFARGQSGAEVAGAVVRGDRALYSLGARAGQTLTARIAAPERNAVFQIYTPGATARLADGMLEVAGTVLPGTGETDDARSFTGRLPASGDYLIVVGGTRGNATYRLSVTIR